ncbi:MAG TPA: acetyltransferase [Candidatus Sulfotelmatobacter sp.]|nr:acetyltransferase [Candidatus Sulfotelmatobacter sp.]
MSKLKDIVILGAGGLGREILALIEACNAEHEEWNVLGFLDSDPNLAGSAVSAYRVLGNDEWRGHSHDSVWFVCAIGDPRVRCEVAKRFSAMGCRFASLIHPDVEIPKSVQIGAGAVVMAGTRFTIDAKIGSHVVIYINCSITHDVEIADFCMIAPGCNLSGGAVLEEGVQLGTGVSILPRRRVGAWALVGAGSVVTRDIPANSTAVGVPCRPIVR